MHDCPYCDADLNRPTPRRPGRTDTAPGRKSGGHELVACPDCGGIIDGFAFH